MVVQSLEPFYDQFDPDFINIRKTVREVLQKEDDLNEIVQLVGKVSRPSLYAYHLHHRLRAVCTVQLFGKVRTQPHACHLHHRLHAVCAVQLVGKVSGSSLHAYHLHHRLLAVCTVQLVGKISRSNPAGWQGQ